MTFNENADISGNRVKRAGGRGRTAAMGGGGGLLLILLAVLFGGNIDLSTLTGTDQAGTGTETGSDALDECQTGADANEDVECRMQGAALSLDDYWETTLPRQANVAYALPDFAIFTGQVTTDGCGSASSAVGPFYCPADQTVYVDTTFFEQLRTDFGAGTGTMAELYVVAHEFGHHIQNQLGTMNAIDRTGTGPTSDAVRLELQADCYAGMWARDAATTRDANGETFIQPLTRADVESALSAAASVGDDHIQETFSGEVTPHTWTHGSAESRQRWFLIGYEQGSIDSCDTFAVSGGQL